MRPYVCSLLCLCLHAVPAAALSLADAEALWRDNNRELQLAGIAVQAAEADLRSAGQRPNPDFSTNVSSISPGTGYGSGGWQDKKIDTVFRLDQVIERGDKRELRQRGAGERLAAARSDVAATFRQQRMVLHRAYYDLKLAQERLQLAEDNAALLGRSLEVGRRRLKAGDVAPVDVSRLAIDQARAEADARQARADVEAARQLLAYLIGRDGDAATLVADEAWPVPVDLPPASELTDDRPDLTAGRQRIAAAEAERDLARAKRSRDVTVGVQYERNQQGGPVNSYGFGVSVPLYLWHAHEGDIARAEADVDASKGAYAQQRAQAFGQLAQARSALAATLERVRRLDGGMLGDAERVARAAELAYRKGAMGLIDLLDARRTLRQIQIEAATARADYAKALSDWALLTAKGNTP